MHGVAIAPDALVIRQLKEHHASPIAGGFPALRFGTRPFQVGHPPVQLRQGLAGGVVLQPAPIRSGDWEVVLLRKMQVAPSGLGSASIIFKLLFSLVIANCKRMRMSARMVAH